MEVVFLQMQSAGIMENARGCRGGTVRLLWEVAVLLAIVANGTGCTSRARNPTSIMIAPVISIMPVLNSDEEARYRRDFRWPT